MGLEPTISRSEVWRVIRYATGPAHVAVVQVFDSSYLNLDEMVSLNSKQRFPTGIQLHLHFISSNSCRRRAYEQSDSRGWPGNVLQGKLLESWPITARWHLFIHPKPLSIADQVSFSAEVLKSLYHPIWIKVYWIEDYNVDTDLFSVICKAAVWRAQELSENGAHSVCPARKKHETIVFQ